MKLQLYCMLKAALCFISIFTFVSCAPGLGGTLELSPVSQSAESSPALRAHADRLHIQLRPFVDARPRVAIAEIKGREVLPTGDLSALVQAAFEARLHDNGINISDPNAPILGGQIEAWEVKVVPNFPASEASAEARIAVEVLTIDNQLMFRGRYSGTTTIQHPLLNDVRIAKALSQAMGYAIDEALRDERLIVKLEHVYHPIY